MNETNPETVSLTSSGKILSAYAGQQAESGSGLSRMVAERAGRNAEKVYRLRVFASMRTSACERTIFDLKQDSIRQYIHDNAEILTKEEDRRIIALSTCTDSGMLKRTAVFCYIYE